MTHDSLGEGIPLVPDVGPGAGSDVVPDVVMVEGLRVVGRHGVLPEEQVRPQPFVVDLALELDTREAGRSDDLDETVNYAAAAETAARVVADESHALLERVASRIAELLLSDSRVRRVTIGVRKPHAPLGLDAAAVGVRIARSRSDFPGLS